MIEFCDLKLCEECGNQYSSTYINHENNICVFCVDKFERNIKFWIKWEAMEGGEDND